MPTASTTATLPVALDQLRRLTPAVAAFVAGCGPVVLLGFSSGGYPVEAVAGYGVALWWLLLVGFLTDALPRPRPTRTGWTAIAAVGALAAWGALSLTQSTDTERGLTEVARLVVAGGSLLLGMSAVRAGQARGLAGGVLAGLTAIVVAAVLTRLFPDLVPSATQTGEFLQSTRTRLAWPLNYWNGIAAAAAMGIPLALALSSRAQTAWSSAAAIAPVPALVLGIAYTLSRGGIGAAVLGVAATLVLVAPRLLVVRTAVPAAVGSAAVLLAGLRPDALTDVTGGAAQSDAGRRVFVVLLVATAGLALVQAGLRSADRALWTPRFPRPRGRGALALATLVVVAVVGVAAALDAPGELSHGWDRFRDRQVTATAETANSADRLSSVSGNGRYQMWSGAIDALKAEPLSGIGLGSWESWWNPRRGDTGFVRNAHSELFELLAETGLIGGALFALLIGLPIGAGAVAAVRRRRSTMQDPVLVVPALVAFAFALLVDWNWQLGALMVAGLTLAAVSLGQPGDAPPQDAPTGDPRRRRVRRLAAASGITVVSVAAIATLALSLVAPQAVDASRDAASRGDLAGAIAEASRGESAAGFAASPALQRAVVEEQAGNLAAAEASGRRAAARTPEDWRPWFLIARIATARGETEAAVAAYRRARRLNPESSLLKP
ncbi:O-antigen ligase family protein [Patulibacter sp. NPDC049589]|uniref:O-antigen ligase family protein n=1 Tax=Patulibacter sp. NPDC049589 TaxID=3154731 RepID=UPI0034294CC9